MAPATFHEFFASAGPEPNPSAKIATMEPTPYASVFTGTSQPTPEPTTLQPAGIVTPTPIPPPIPTPTPASAIALSPTNPSITTPSPNITVSVPATSGPVTFSLVVTDNLGNQSAPALITIEIQPAPVAVLSTSTPSVRAGAPIELSATSSVAAAPGTITSYRYTLVSQP